jgi:eukaryotic-like serine/threonine-protein kinase
MISFARYELLALLAKGELAEIWLARQKGLAGFERFVVVKRLHARLAQEREYVDMFLDEASINSRLQHSNVLQVYELGEAEGTYYLAMEYVEGLPLGVLAHKAVQRLGDVPIPIAGALIHQAAQGLHYAHEALDAEGNPLEIVHRDVSPLNLIVSFDGIVKVADFGIAKALGRRARTKSGLVKGTPTYMSPEQCTGEPVDRRSDVFSLGVLFWELLSGRRLFKRPTVDATYDAITKGSVPPPSTYRPELPSNLDALCLRALARRPMDRFPTAARMGQELEQALHKQGLRAEVVDVRAFLEQHFAPERAEQEALIGRVRGADESLDRTPLFQRAEHGLDSGREEPPLEIGYTDDDTTRESPPMMTPPVEHAPIGVPSAPSLDAAAITGPQPPLLSEVLPAVRARWPYVVAIVLLIAIAALIGLYFGRLRRPASGDPGQLSTPPGASGL